MNISERVKHDRIDFLKKWPNTKKFECEINFEHRISLMKDIPLYYPIKFSYNDDNDLHTVISFIIESLDCLPYKPDNSFDWLWKSFEFCLGKIYTTENITEKLQKLIKELSIPTEKEIVLGANSLINLAKEIPFQTCEYLFKKISQDGSFKPTPQGKIGKRTLLNNGNGAIIVYPNLQTLLDYITTSFSINNHEEVRKAASLLRKAIKQNEVTLKEIKITLSDDEIYALIISSLTYSFRNDRTHAELFAPFRSSTATLTTYAHCWYMTLVVHCLLITIINKAIPTTNLDINIDDNIKNNIDSFKKLFGDYRNK